MPVPSDPDAVTVSAVPGANRTGLRRTWLLLVLLVGVGAIVFGARWDGELGGEGVQGGLRGSPLQLPERGLPDPFRSLQRRAGARVMALGSRSSPRSRSPRDLPSCPNVYAPPATSRRPPL